MKAFLTKVLSWLPLESPTAVTRRIKEAVTHLDGSDPLPHRAWCHMDLIEHFSVSNSIPLLTMARTPIQSPRWLGQMHKTTPNPVTSSNGMAYNGIDHFATFLPDMQRALANSTTKTSLQAGAMCVASGVVILRSVSQTSSLVSLHILSYPPSEYHPLL